MEHGPSQEACGIVSDDLVDAIDDTRYGRSNRLYNIIGGMIVVRGVKQPDDINEVRSHIYENVAELIHRGTTTIDIARQLRTIVGRRIADYLRRRTRALSLAGKRVVSLDEVMESGEDVTDLTTADDAYLANENIRIFQEVLDEMRNGDSERDRRDFLILEAYLDDVPVQERIKEILDKNITSAYAATLLYRAKQNLKSRLISKGIRGDEI
jgi:DNA-directed RNA polymerase specialized sigma24 family protein